MNAKKLFVSARLLCVLAVVLLASQIRADGALDLTLAVSGSSYFWNAIKASTEHSINTNLASDVMTALNLKDGVTISTVSVNDTAMFATIHLESAGSADEVANTLYSATLTKLNDYLATDVTTNFPAMKPYLVANAQFYAPLFPGPLPMAWTSPRFDVLLSGNSSVWTNVISTDDFKAIFTKELTTSITHGNVSASCVVNELVPTAAGVGTKGYGNGEGGLLVGATCTQEYQSATDEIYHVYECSAAAATMNMDAISAAYNKVSADKTVIKVLYSYWSSDDMVKCTGLCIAAMTLVAAVVFLSLIAVILACISVNCYKVNNVELKMLYTAAAQQYGMRTTNTGGRRGSNPGSSKRSNSSSRRR